VGIDPIKAGCRKTERPAGVRPPPRGTPTRIILVTPNKRVAHYNVNTVTKTITDQKLLYVIAPRLELCFAMGLTTVEHPDTVNTSQRRLLTNGRCGKL
jgi:hypothetical protein